MCKFISSGKGHFNPKGHTLNKHSKGLRRHSTHYVVTHMCKTHNLEIVFLPYRTAPKEKNGCEFFSFREVSILKRGAIDEKLLRNLSPLDMRNYFSVLATQFVVYFDTKYQGTIPFGFRKSDFIFQKFFFFYKPMCNV